jgi:DNA-binding SARP family transcriptional activator
VALSRDRLSRALDKIWDARVGIVLGPAGAGKTTVLAEFAIGSARPVAWYRADHADTTAEAVAAHLGAAIGRALGLDLPPVSDVEALVAATEEAVGDHTVAVVVDDVHALAGSPGEAALAAFVEWAPPNIRVVMASRLPPALNLSRLRVSGDLVEITPDDLRFRSWEVEQLFRDLYGEPLPPEDLAVLARRTEGWAAALQLFHLATTGKSTSERRQVLAALATRSRIVREYLTRNVLDELPEPLRGFLLRTSVLGRLTPEVCDRLLERTDSAVLLADLEQRQLFTVAVDGGAEYRYHEVLRSHVEGVLVERLNDAELRSLYRRAGALQQRAGALPDALRAYCRAGDWEAVTAVLGLSGERLAADGGTWIEALPPALVAQDPWLLLATARRHLAQGGVSEALSTYGMAERAFGSGAAAEQCRAERLSLAAWLELGAAPAGGWLGAVRAAVRQGGASALAASTAEEAFARGTALLLSGSVTDARDILLDVAEIADTRTVLSLAARLLASAAALLAGDDIGALELELLGDEAERAGLPWATTMARAMLALSPETSSEAELAAIREGCRRRGDPLGEAVATLCLAFGRLWDGDRAAGLFADAADQLRRLGAGAVEAWAHAGRALALDPDDPDALPAARAAEAFARSVGGRGPRAMALEAMARVVGGATGAEHRAESQAIAQELGLRWPSLPPEPADAVLEAMTRRSAEEPPHGRANGHNGNGNGHHAHEPVAAAEGAVVVRALGGFTMTVGGRPVDLHGVRPRARAVLYLLALRAGQPIHREQLAVWLWPDADSRTAVRNLHVAMSSLRQLLEPDSGRGHHRILVRDGDAYLLAVGDAADVDFLALEREVAAGRAALVAGDHDTGTRLLTSALARYAGELLPEVGPAEWVLHERDRYRLLVADAAQVLAERHLSDGDSTAGVRACEVGLAADRYRDGLWRLWAELLVRAGDDSSAARVRGQHAAVRAELGLDPV